MVFGLDVIRELLSRLGNPQDKLQFVHIAGTNGKGSTLAFISTILQCAGYRVGRYSSPRVFEYEEFVQVNGVNIEKEAFCRYTEQAKTAIVSMEKDGIERPSLFEVETVIGFLYFVEKQCDVVVLECGLGGRDDATNVVDRVLCNVLAPIGLDHMGILGSTLAEIATAKAGIIKSDAPVCVGRQEKEAMDVIRAACAKTKSPLYVVDASRRKVYRDVDASGKPRLQLRFDYREFSDLRVCLLGRYQADNACLAIEVVRALNQAGLSISEEALRKGLETAVWPGRFEVIGTDPLVILDGAHNPHGMRRLKESLEYYFSGKHLYGIMGVLADKAYGEECEMIAPLFEKFFTITPPNNPRALQAEKLAEDLKTYHSDVTACETIEEAVEGACRVARAEDVILIFGSLSYIGEACQAVKARKRERPARR